MLKSTWSNTKLNWGLAGGAVIAAAIPIIATAATGGLAAVPLVLWVGLGGAVSGLFAGNVEVKTPVERALDADAAKVGRGE
jgi:hypothetical protein